MTDHQREQLLTTLHGLGKSAEKKGDERDVAIAACLYGLCLAISAGAEVELARHILMLDDDEDEVLARAPLSVGDVRGN